RPLARARSSSVADAVTPRSSRPTVRASERPDRTEPSVAPTGPRDRRSWASPHRLRHLKVSIAGSMVADYSDLRRANQVLGPVLMTVQGDPFAVDDGAKSDAAFLTSDDVSHENLQFGTAKPILVGWLRDLGPDHLGMRSVIDFAVTEFNRR